MTCAVEQRDRVRDAARRLARLPCVLAADTLAASDSPRTQWELEATIRGETISPTILRVLAEAECELVADATATRGRPTHTTLVATAA